jgi:hypothetical protein
MQAPKSHLSSGWAPRSLATALTAATACAACAAWADEPSPYYIGATQSVTHSSNVYSSVDGVGDYYSSTGLVGGFDQTISRQRVYANANLTYSKYRNQTRLDNTGYGVAAGWDWQTIEQLSGNLAVTANQSLASPDNTVGLQANTSSEKNLVKTEQLSTSVNWGGAGDLSLQGAYTHSRVRYSAIESLSSQSSADSASATLLYRLGPDIKVGGGLRFSRTYSPYGVVNPTVPVTYDSNTANGRNIDLTAEWRLTAQTGLDTRLSWTRQSNSNAGNLDFSGLTGAVTARYAPTAKLNFSASINRDAGTNGSFFNLPATSTTTSGTTVAPISGLSQSSQTSDGLTLSGSYLVTAKISVTLGASYRRAKQVDMNGVESDDNSRNTSLAVSYAIARSWQLGCNLAHASSTTGSTGASYGVNTVGCTAQVTLR